MEVLDKRYSELTSSLLGESEKAIAASFEEAADLGAFLILDEADSLLRDRGAARIAPQTLADSSRTGCCFTTRTCAAMGGR